MKNIKKKRSLILVFIMLALIALICLTFVRREKVVLNESNPRTDIEVLAKWFPNLEGMEHAIWEVDDLSSNSSRVPGPSAFWARGFIYLQKETAEKYKSDYEWEERDIKLECDTIDITTFNNTTWYYSKAFEDEMKPASYLGNFYFNGEVIWFDVTK